ncbi:MAG TPA: hypothetical protein VGR78_19595, partial [Verrucomicrobiae bacterium]|nr:hypothetical protein [Verrucomicrobiae bacterium]
DQSSQTVCRLIHSCFRSQEGFHSAAQVVEDAGLKRLLGIYAQQRTRFAEELRVCMPSSLEFDALSDPEQPERTVLEDDGAAGLLAECVESDRRTLALYREALADRSIPTRAHFLISAQCSLLQRVHDRMYGLLSASSMSSVNPTISQGERVRL